MNIKIILLTEAMACVVPAIVLLLVTTIFVLSDDLSTIYGQYPQIPISRQEVMQMLAVGGTLLGYCFAILVLLKLSLMTINNEIYKYGAAFWAALCIGF